MRVSERGQVTIPKTIREQFNLGINTEIEFVIKDGRLELLPVKEGRRKKIDDIYGKKRFSKTTDELMSLLRT